MGRTGLRVSVLGFGGSPLGNEFGEVDPGEGTRAVHAAIDGGINFFDVSPYYGRTLAEERLGAALEGKRKNVIVSTKCGRYDKQTFDFSGKRVTSSVDESLGRLRTDYLDLLFAHDIEFGDREQIVDETIPAMRELQRQGKIRWVGISGLPLRMLADVAERGNVDTVLSYCHYNLMIQDLDQELARVVSKQNAGLVNASPLHMGLLSDSGPPPWHPAPENVKAAARQVVALCRSRGVDPAGAAIRFCVRYPHAATTLVGISTLQQVKQNLEALASNDAEDLLAEIVRVVDPVRDMTWASGRAENSDV